MNELAIDQSRGADDTGLMASATLPSDIQAVAERVYRQAVAVRIESDADYSAAAELAADISQSIKSIDADRVKLKAPFLAGTRQIDDYFRGPIARREEAIRTIKGAMLDWDEAKRREAEAERQRLQAEERAREAEARRKEKEAQERLRAEETARRQAAEAAQAQERAKREAAEAEAWRARQAAAAAEAAARGDQAAAKAAEARAKQAEIDAKNAKKQAEIDREAAIEARRKQLAAERETAAAAEAAAQAQTAAQEATTAAVAGPAALAKVDGVSRRRVWKFRLKAPLDKVPMRYHCLDTDKVQEVVDRLKDLAAETLGDCFEVYFEDELAVGRGRKK
jgi:chemotaxis protein histidine kinase CheA